MSLSIGVLAALVAASIGTIYGAVSSYNGGFVDSFMMRIVDILYALPYMFLVIILVTILGKSLLLLFLALGAVGWLLTACCPWASDESQGTGFCSGRLVVLAQQVEVLFFDTLFQIHSAQSL